MADAFQPTFVDLVSNYTTTTGTGNFTLGPAVNGFTSFASALKAGDSFYYSVIGLDKPVEREVGRGTLQADGTISRDPVSGTKISFTGGTKTIALVAAAEWFASMQAGNGGSSPVYAATRTALAAVTQRQAPVLLTEPGREGMFVFSSANLASLVAADTAQGIYVAPASDPSGASGAWVRRYSGPVSVKWFGADSSGVAASGPAFTCALAVLGLSATNSGLGYGGQGCPTLFVPAGQYYLATTTIDIAKTMRVIGEGNGQTGGPSTVLRWADATTGMRIQAYNTTGANGLVTGAPVTSARGDATIIEGLYLRGGYAGTESEAHGIHIRALCSIRDVYIDNFPGDGIYAYTTIGDPANGGNASSSKLTNITCAGNRNGMFFKGADANACVIIGADCRGNRQWGIWDSSFLGNFFYGCHTAGNGWDGAIGSKPTACTVAGHRYYVKPGQAAGAATNAPTGTTADNSWWGYGSEGGTYNGVVAWTSGTQFREGGAYKVDNANATAAFIGCYAEGDQNPSQVAAPAVMVGGNAVLGNAASGLSLRSDTGGAMQLGPTKGGRDGATYLETSGTAHLLQGRIWTGTSPVNIASLGFYNGFGTIHDVQNASWQHRFRVNGAGICNIGSGGLQVVSGSLGYGTGAGATVTQATSKSSAVTINKACGQIVTAADALAAGAVAEFSVANSQVAATDLVSVAIASGAAASSAYRCWVSAVAAGSFKVCIENRSAGSLAEALVLNFTVTKAVAA